MKSPAVSGAFLSGPFESLALRAEAIEGQDIPVLGLRYEEETDHEGHEGDHDRVPEAVVDVAGGCHHRESCRRQEAAEPAVGDVVGQGQRTVAKPGAYKPH